MGKGPRKASTTVVTRSSRAPRRASAPRPQRNWRAPRAVIDLRAKPSREHMSAGRRPSCSRDPDRFERPDRRARTKACRATTSHALLARTRANKSRVAETDRDQRKRSTRAVFQDPDHARSRAEGERRAAATGDALIRSVHSSRTCRAASGHRCNVAGLDPEKIVSSHFFARLLLTQNSAILVDDLQFG